jgi:hypothetical protein
MNGGSLYACVLACQPETSDDLEPKFSTELFAKEGSFYKDELRSRKKSAELL